MVEQVVVEVKPYLLWVHRDLGSRRRHSPWHLQRRPGDSQRPRELVGQRSTAAGFAVGPEGRHSGRRPRGTLSCPHAVGARCGYGDHWPSAFSLRFQSDVYGRPEGRIRTPRADPRHARGVGSPDRPPPEGRPPHASDRRNRGSLWHATFSTESCLEASTGQLTTIIPWPARPPFYPKQTVAPEILVPGRRVVGS